MTVVRDLPRGLPSRTDTSVSCDRCGVTVLVGKTSWQQTSIQWPEDGTASCAEFSDAAQEPAPQFAAAVRGCSALRRAIDKAALANALPVTDDS